MAKRYHNSAKSGSSMIKANRTAMANLPQEVIMKHYPKMPYGLTSSIDDTLSGIDKQMTANGLSGKGVFSPKKY